MSDTKKKFLQQWTLGVSCGVTGINDINRDNIIYECNSDYVTLCPKMNQKDQWYYIITNS
jgi:hypothetical protein